MKKKFVILVAIIFLSSPVSAGTKNLADVLTAYLKGHYPWAEIELNELRLSADAPSGGPSAIVVEQSPPGRTMFTLSYNHGVKVTATATVKAYDYVVLSRRSLNKDAVLQKDDVYTALTDISRIPKGAVRNEKEIIGKSLSRGIATNVTIADNMLNATGLVKKGQKVVLVVDAPGLTVKAPGELQQNSAVGNYVKVLNIASHKLITGLLMDEHTVKVGL